MRKRLEMPSGGEGDKAKSKTAAPTEEELVLMKKLKWDDLKSLADKYGVLKKGGYKGIWRALEERGRKTVRLTTTTTTTMTTTTMTTTTPYLTDSFPLALVSHFHCEG